LLGKIQKHLVLLTLPPPFPQQQQHFHAPPLQQAQVYGGQGLAHRDWSRRQAHGGRTAVQKNVSVRLPTALLITSSFTAAASAVSSIFAVVSSSIETEKNVERKNI
jgi:hypothetical protein